MRQRYFYRPLENSLSTDYPEFNVPFSMATWPTKNIKVNQHSIKKRWGYGTADKDLGDGVDVQQIAIYRLKDGTSPYTMYLTDTDLIKRETSGSNTWSYKTTTYTTGSVINITTDTVTGSGTSWYTSGLAAGDKFILDTDHSSAVEEDANWAEILTVDANGTEIVLTGSYSGTTGAMSETYKGRMVYSTPTDERWSYTIVGDKFCFTNGNTNVQYWDGGSGYAADLDTSHAINARYCIEYANRLIIADYGTSRDPLGLAWSGENDPTEFNPGTDNTAGSIQFLETKDFITGLGRVGAVLLVYKRDSIIFGNRTGIATGPFNFPRTRKGIGCVAPHSIIDFMGTNAFIGRDDFYVIDAEFPRPIGERIRDKFFAIVGYTELEKVWGFLDQVNNELIWVANTSEGKYAFVWNYRLNQWTSYEFGHDIVIGGQGAK